MSFESTSGESREDYFLPEWQTRIRGQLQYQLVAACMPLSLKTEAERERWALAWLRRYAVPCAQWLMADKERYVRIAKRIHWGKKFSRHELEALALTLENA